MASLSSVPAQASGGMKSFFINSKGIKGTPTGHPELSIRTAKCLGKLLICMHVHEMQ